MGCAEGLGESAGLVPPHDGGHGHGDRFGDDGQLGLSTAAGDRHDAVSHGESGRPLSQPDHLAGEFHPGDVRGRTRGGG